MGGSMTIRLMPWPHLLNKWTVAKRRGLRSSPELRGVRGHGPAPPRGLIVCVQQNRPDGLPSPLWVVDVLDPIHAQLAHLAKLEAGASEQALKLALGEAVTEQVQVHVTA